MGEKNNVLAIVRTLM